MKFEPMPGRVQIRPDPTPDAIGRIILPDVAKKRPGFGTVVAVGPPKILDSGVPVPAGVGIGDRVAYTQHYEYMSDDIQVLEGDIIIPDYHILAKLEN